MTDDEKKPSPPQVPDNQETTTSEPGPEPKTVFDKDD